MPSAHFAGQFAEDLPPMRARAALPLAAAAAVLLLARWRRRRRGPPPRYAILSRAHRQWLEPALRAAGWAEGAPEESALTLRWELRKSLLPRPQGAVCFNSLPQLKHFDDKAILALLSCAFTRTRPLVTHVLYGEWDVRISPRSRRDVAEISLGMCSVANETCASVSPLLVPCHCG